jgi:glycosyltransferase involved in cell wall biosynthesis
MRGGERVLESLCRMYPDADIYTNVYDPSRVSETIRKHRVRTTFIQHLPFARRWYQRYLPLMPLALERLDLRGYRLVISSEAGPAKNVIVDPEAVHVCYCHTPMRYLWDMSREYTAGVGVLPRVVVNVLLHYLRLTDVTSAARVDEFIANSRFVALRIRKYWRREAVVVPPPVETKRFHVTPGHDGTYLWLGQLAAYKRPDIAVEAFTANGKPLVVAGDGPQRERLRRRAGPNVSFYGWADDDATVRLLENCRALIFTGIEDFGIVPLEAMACGKPVIAFRRGGALDTVREGVTGLFFDQQTPEALNRAVLRFEAEEDKYHPTRIRAWADRFDEVVFRKALRQRIDVFEKQHSHQG